MKRVVCVAALVLAAGAWGQHGAPSNGEWPFYGGDSGSTKYGPLGQIDASNVSDLGVAWVWDSIDNSLIGDKRHLMPGEFKSTPIMVDGVLYFPTMLNIVVALDPVTGEELWTFDTKAREGRRPGNLGWNHKGVAYWESEDGSERRILFNSNDAYLWSIDAKTGELDSGFGDEGRVDLTLGMRRPVNRRMYMQTAPGIVIGDRIVLGSAVFDVPSGFSTPPGDVRAFDVRTGEQVWTFETIPQPGQFGNETWEDGSWQYTGSANVWTFISTDPELGYVYLPTSTPTNDWYGGHRPGDNLFAESLVCVDAETGERVWHFQFVHHGLWDYDLPAAPVLCDITVDGKPVKAVAQITKQGSLFVFDRVTGEPVWPIEEKPVPQSTVEGEKTSPTQPHPTWPEPFEPQGTFEEDLIDFTPEMRAEALEVFKQFDTGPLFTPPSERGVLARPGWGGGGNWSGAAFDPETGMFYVPSWQGYMVVQLVKPDPNRSAFKYIRGGKWDADGPYGLPLFKPPYGRITAYDLNTGDKKWVVPHGDGYRQQLVDFGIPDPGPTGKRDSTGPLLTKTLLFVAQSGNVGGGAGATPFLEDMKVNAELGAVDIDIPFGGKKAQKLPEPEPVPHYLRAFDKATGDVLAEIELPGPPNGAPMTYLADGKQYIAIPVGGGANARMIALTLNAD